YHYLLHADLLAPLRVANHEPDDLPTVLRWSEARRIAVDMADWWRRTPAPVPAELIPLLFFPLALLTTEAEAEDARQVVHAAWTKAGLLSPDQVDALAAGYTGYIYSDKAWVDDPEDGFYIPGVHSLRGAPGIVTRAMTKFTAAL